MPTKTPSAVFRGNPPTDLHQPAPSDVVTILTEMIAETTAVDGRATAVEGRATALEGRATSLEARATVLEGTVTASVVFAATWSALSAMSGDFEGQGGEVLDDDAGTHAQATATGYDGSTVDNGGRYSWNDGWSRWVRIGNTGLAGKAAVAALDAEATAREDADDALSAEIAKLGLYQAQTVTFAEGYYTHATTGDQEEAVALATGSIAVVPGEVGRFTSSISGSATTVAAIVFKTAGGAVVSTVKLAPGVGQTASYVREPFTVPATAATLGYTVLVGEVDTAVLEIRRNTSGALAAARDDLDLVLAAAQGYAPVDVATLDDTYYRYSDGVALSASSFTSLAPIGVTPGETLLLTAEGSGGGTAKVVWRSDPTTFHSYEDRHISDASYVREEIVVPSGVAYGLFTNFGDTPPVVEQYGYGPATLDGVAVVQRQVTRLRGVNDYWRGAEWVWNGTSIPYGSGGVGYPQRVAELLGATVQNKTIPSSACRIGVPEGVSADDPYGWTGMPFNNVIRAFSATRAEKQSFIDDYESKWRARVTGGPTVIGGSGTPSAAEILDMSFETLLVPYLDRDLFVFDHFRNDAAVSVSGTSGSEVTVIPGVDVTVDAVGDPVTTRDRRWAIGAANYIFDVIRNANPRARIVIFGHYENTRDPYIAQAQQYLADLWGIPIVPLWSRLGWSSQTAQVEESPVSLLDIWMADGIHPVSDPDGEATELIAQAAAPFIRDLR